MKKVKKTPKTVLTDNQQSSTNATDVKKHGGQKEHKANPRQIPLHLPTVEQVHEIPEAERFCSCCGLPFESMNTEETSYEVTVEIVYKLIKHIRKKYSKTCSCSKTASIIRAKAPIKLFPRGLYSIDFWIKTLLDKYAHGIPLNRQINAMHLENLNIAPSTLCNGLIKISEYIKPLYELMIERIAFSDLVHADETRWKNWAHTYDPLRTDEKDLHWLWGFFSSKYHVFIIDPTRSSSVIKNNFGQC